MATSPLHILVYGDSGAGKSTFLATLPKPMLVFSWDPRGKESPYLRCGRVELLEDGTQRVWSRKHKDRLLIQVEHYIDTDPQAAEAYAAYLSRMAQFDADGEITQWASIVSDSTTFMEIAARKRQQYKLNPHTKEPRQWYASGTETLEEQLMLRFGSLPCNVGVACHIDDKRTDMHGNALRVPNAPGRLSKNLGAAYSELYRLLLVREEGPKGKGTQIVRWLQTQPDEEWMAGTQIQGLPQFVEPSYKAIRAYMAEPE